MVAVVLALALVTPAAGITNIPGWAQTKWGMTPAQVRALYPNVQSAPHSGMYSWTVLGSAAPLLPGLVLRDVDLVGQKFEVLFFFENEHLRNIVLRPQGPLSVAQAKDLAEDLFAKYGGSRSVGGNGSVVTVNHVAATLNAMIRFQYDTSRPQGTFVEYDYNAHFGGTPSAPQRQINPHL